jgi:hypothetical protein
MNTQILFDNGLIKVEYNENQRQLTHSWNGFVLTDQYKESLKALHDATQKYHPERILADQRKRKVLPQEAAEWFIKEWFPKFYTSIKQPVKVAFIDADDIFGKMSSHSNINKLVSLFPNQKLVTYKFFEDFEEAEQWLTA